MEEKPKSYSFHILNIGALLLVLSVVGSTLRFTVISATLVSWLQTKWLEYTSFLKNRRSARLAATADELHAQRRKQVADISESIGENVVALLDERRERILKLTQEAERKRHDSEREIMERVVVHLAEFQERERVAKEEQFKAREYNVSVREYSVSAQESSISAQEKKIKNRDEALQALQKKLEEREQKLKDEEGALRMARGLFSLQQEEFERTKVRQFNQPAKAAFTPSPAISPPLEIPLPHDLLIYVNELNSSSTFTCIGITQQGARCRQSFISSASKSAAADRISKMQSPSPKAEFFELDALHELADWMLCPRWHLDKKPQGGTISRRWYCEISDSRARLKQSNSLMTPSGISTPSTVSTGAPSIFGSSNASIGTASSVASFTGSGSGSGSSLFGFGSSWAASEQGYKNPAARNLTPMFEAVARQPR
jgi:hypothetical protein